MNIGIASDHNGYKLSQKLTKYLTKKGYDVVTFNSDTFDQSDDYPDFAFKLGEAIREQELDFGIVICKSGIGISIACNKVKRVRCALVSTPKEAYLTRLDNDANVLALSGKTSLLRAKDIIDKFLKTKFSEKERHIRRVEKINNYN